MGERRGSGRSGWCSPGPVGSNPPHRHCRAEVCTCPCHTEEEKDR